MKVGQRISGLFVDLSIPSVRVEDDKRVALGLIARAGWRGGRLVEKVGQGGVVLEGVKGRSYGKVGTSLDRFRVELLVWRCR